MLKIYNTLTNKKEIFKPLKGKKVSMYTCGPTVYNYAHIGNMRAYVTADILRRYLEYSGYRVQQIKNITDVGHMVSDSDEGEDKMLKAAKKENRTPQEIALFYEEAFKQDEEKLNIKPASLYPRATSYIDKMIEVISILIKKGYAYQSNGSVYFETNRFSRYGQLSGNVIDKLKAGARIEKHSDKRNPEDFALWIKAPENHILKWKSPWSIGYPGWHIECTAMSQKLLGDTIDIHTGGEDNIFPHHECEIAQSEASTDKKFVKYWVHTRHLLVDGKKMAKSDGNFFTIRDVENKGYSPIAIRFLYLTADFKDSINFTFKSLESASKTLENLDDFLFTLDSGPTISGKLSKTIKEKAQKFIKMFKAAMDDNLNTAKAVSELFEFIQTINKEIKSNKLSDKDKREIKKTLKSVDTVFGFIEKTGEKVEIDEDTQMLIADRDEARREKDWARSDALRDQLEEEGILIEDTQYGP
ncbi:cysteine--tRNA ligase, partial [bacterium]|nr:cysteine--tRNA ligase [bacterium]